MSSDQGQDDPAPSSVPPGDPSISSGDSGQPGPGTAGSGDADPSADPVAAEAVAEDMQDSFN